MVLFKLSGILSASSRKGQEQSLHCVGDSQAHFYLSINDKYYLIQAKCQICHISYQWHPPDFQAYSFALRSNCMESDILWNYWLLRVADSSEGPRWRMWPLIKRVLTQYPFSFPFTSFKLPVQHPLSLCLKTLYMTRALSHWCSLSCHL